MRDRVGRGARNSGSHSGRPVKRCFEGSSVNGVRAWFLAFMFLMAAGLETARADAARAEINPGMVNLELSPFVTYLVDTDSRADAATMFQHAADGDFQALPQGNATFGFGKGAYWFHSRLFNNGNS